MMTASEVRKSFLNFFESKGHKIVPSAPMVIKNDPTLMFTNAGMNQFKDIILGNRPIVDSRIANSQKCLRVSGKHNDLEEVGHDTYHHTMFEMLGNWSFGDYFKEDAIDWAWEYLTDVLKIDRERLYVTVFEGSSDDNLQKDHEAYSFWLKHVAAQRIINGNKKDNFWEMGDTGPCGPCSEIHIDLRPELERQAIPGHELVNKDHPQVIEIWNNVFMQYNRKANGDLEPLPKQHVDTGMGFERLVRVVQGKTSNYDTDIFTPIISEISRISGIQYGAGQDTDVAMRVMADHIRTIAFSITDGQLPSNNKAGYVIRRILRRAVRYSYTFLNTREATMYRLVPVLIQIMGGAYPELVAQQDLVQKVIKEEEESFLRTLATGIGMLDKIIGETKAGNYIVVNGKVAFELYDTYGFPLDLTELILKEHGLVANRREFEECMNQQKERARSATAIETDDWVTLVADDHEEFVGYDYTEAEVVITRYRKVKAKNKELYQLVFNITPFYAESGGQVGDSGFLVDGSERTAIIDTVKENNLIVHLTSKLPSNPKASFRAEVDVEKRTLTADNHTATHLMHEALREILGKHVEQKGSLVTPEYLRFDFAHFQKVSPEELAQVEKTVNHRIRQNIPLEEMREIPIQKAHELGAMALFGEKYGDVVRAIRFGSSTELCGGTHVKATGQLGFFKIISESSISAGIRRIEAVTAVKAEEFINHQQNLLREISGMLKSPANLQKSVENVIAENAMMGQKVDAIIRSMMNIEKRNLIDSAVKVGNICVIVAQVKPFLMDYMKDLSFQLRNELDEVVAVLGCDGNDKPQLSVIASDSVVSDHHFNAIDVIRAVSHHIQGGGGGQPFFASAGGKKADGVQTALDAAMAMVLERLKA